MPGTIYDQQQSSVPAFRDFIGMASEIPGLLPPWWSGDSVRACIAFSDQSAVWSLRHAQEKSDIQEAWSDSTMPMKLRIIGETVYGVQTGVIPEARNAMLS